MINRNTSQWMPICRLFQADRLRDDLCDELIDGFDADHGEHRFQILGIGDADVAVGKFIKHRILRMIFL